jgi:hypothetical protein
MSRDLQSASFSVRFEHLVQLISSERFLKKEGLGNEVPFFICPFDGGEWVEFERSRKRLTNRLSQQGVRVLDINLYDLAIERLQHDGDWEWLLENESSGTKDDLLENLQSVLDVETVIVPEIATRIANTDFEVLFLSGVGEVFPYIRSHNVLNNLQRVAKEKPTVMFFPGKYSHSLANGASLDLFGRLHDDKYYRAFNIFDREI